MPLETIGWLDRIKSVEREYAVIRLATTLLLTTATRDPSMLGKGMRNRDLRDAVQRLEGTYLVRLFAEFETGLRQFWHTMRKSAPRTRYLVERIGALRQAPPDDVSKVHAVREYRNMLVHEREEPCEPVLRAEARGRLCRFFARLPADW